MCGLWIQSEETKCKFLKIIFCMIIFFGVAFSNIKFWIKSAYVWYISALILIILVTFVGNVGMGAQRWLSLGFINIQPSEFIKIALVLALYKLPNLLLRQINRIII